MLKINTNSLFYKLLSKLFVLGLVFALYCLIIYIAITIEFPKAINRGLQQTHYVPSGSREPLKYVQLSQKQINKYIHYVGFFKANRSLFNEFKEEEKDVKKWIMILKI